MKNSRSVRCSGCIVLCLLVGAASVAAQSPRTVKELHGIQPGRSRVADLAANVNWGQPQKTTPLGEGLVAIDYSIAPWQRVVVLAKDEAVRAIDLIPPADYTPDEISQSLELGELAAGQKLERDATAGGVAAGESGLVSSKAHVVVFVTKSGGTARVSRVRLLAASERTAADLLPASTTIYVEVSRPKELLAVLLDSPLSRKILARPEVLAAFQEEKFQTQIADLERLLGQQWRPAAEALATGGLYFAEAGPADEVILFKAHDSQALGKVVNLIEEVRRQDIAAGRPGSAPTKMHRGINIYDFDRKGQFQFAACESWGLAAHRLDRCQALIDAYLDGQPTSLAAEREFVAARRVAEEGDLPDGIGAWGLLRVRAARQAGRGMLSDLLQPATDPALQALQKQLAEPLPYLDFITLALSATPREVRLELAAPLDRRQMPASVAARFPPAASAGVAPLQLPATIVAVVEQQAADRPAAWQNARAAAAPEAAAILDTIEREVSGLFGGRSFDREVLGAFGSTSHIYLQRQSFDPQAATVPACRLPSLGIILELKDSARWRPLIRSAFERAIAEKLPADLPPRSLRTETRGGIELTSATFRVDPQLANHDVLHNFSPSLAFTGRWCVLATTAAQARLLAAQIAQPPAAANADNSQLVVDFGVLKELLAENADQYVANRATAGVAAAQSRTELGQALEMLGWLTQVRLRTRIDDNSARYTIVIGMRD